MNMSTGRSGIRISHAGLVDVANTSTTSAYAVLWQTMIAWCVMHLMCYAWKCYKLSVQQANIDYCLHVYRICKCILSVALYHINLTVKCRHYMLTSVGYLICARYVKNPVEMEPFSVREDTDHGSIMHACLCKNFRSIPVVWTTFFVVSAYWR
jgi:hypothetical protein